MKKTISKKVVKARVWLLRYPLECRRKDEDLFVYWKEPKGNRTYKHYVPVEITYQLPKE